MGRSEVFERGVVGSVFLLHVDGQGGVTAAQGSSEEPLGLCLRELAGKSIFAIFPEAAELRSALARAVAGEHCHAEVRLQARTLQLRLGPSPEGQVVVMGAAAGVPIVRPLPSVVWATDRDLRVIYATGHQTAGRAVDPTPLIGSTVYDLVGSREVTAPVVAHHLAALSGQEPQLAYQFRGRLYHVLLQPLWDAQDHISGVIGVALDITERQRAEEQLAESEARLAEAQRLAHVGSWEWNIDQNRVTWSDELYRVFGLEKDQFAGTFEGYLERVHPDDRERVRSLVLDAFRQGQPFAFDHRIIRPDGSVRMIQARGAPVADSRGKKPRMAGSCWDVTERWQATEELKRAVSLLEATLEATADGLLVIDRSGRVAAMNQRFLALWGIPPELAARRDDRLLLSFVADQLEDPEGFLRGVADLYCHPERESVDELRFKNGRVFGRYSRPQRLGEEVVGRVWSFRDVTENYRLLRRAELLSDVSRLLGALEPEPALEAVARRMVPFLGTSCAVDLFDSSGRVRRLLTVSHGESAGDGGPRLHRAVRAGHPVRYSAGRLPVMAVPFVGKRGPLGAITFTGTPEKKYSEADLELAEEISQRVAVAIERVRLFEEAQEALRARDEFLSIAAHEIRGPLMSIHLGVESLHQNSVPAAEVPRVLDILLREERRLEQFINDLLEFGRIRAGRFRLEIEEVDLVEVVAEVAQRLHGELARSGSTLTVKTEGPVVGQWDRLRLDQVVNNLLSNAIKFGLGRPIDISAHGREGKAILSVRDHGIGIPPDMQEEVFDPFVRTVSNRRYDGLGLGLYIVRSIVNGLGGEVRSASGPEGTTFTIELPMARVS